MDREYSLTKKALDADDEKKIDFVIDKLGVKSVKVEDVPVAQCSDVSRQQNNDVESNHKMQNKSSSFAATQKMKAARKRAGKTILAAVNNKSRNYWDLYDWSVDHIPELWAEIWDYSGIIYSKPYDKVVDLSAPLEKLPRWFEGAKLNLAENLLKYRDDRVALIIAGEDRETEKMTFFQVYKEVELYAAAFRKFGLKKGDHVVCQMSNRKEAVLAMIAVMSIGAIWSGALPLIGAEAVLNRFKQVEPKIFLTVDTVRNDGKNIEMLPKIKEIVKGLPSLGKVIIVSAKGESYSKDISEIENSCFLNEFLELGREKDGSIPPIQFEQVSSDHPLFINYTSGTTGLPKPLFHGIGYLLAIFRDFSMHFDAHRGSVYFSMSPVGWATWICSTSLLFAGISVVLYEGVPFFISPTYFWDLLDELKMTHVFIPASIIDELQKRGYTPTKSHSLKSLKVLKTGGSVVKLQLYDFFYSNIKKDIAFTSVYGSTEFLGSCFVFDSTLPIYKGEIPAVSLGVNVQVVDETGKSLDGEVGELVVTKPMPNLPLGLWKDEDGALLCEKYFSKYPGTKVLLS
ncbi:Acetoacetyl-CoA synthetase [Araneus ventricosus]|uniref:Acetoacetyl-CoA synthetase n=1 Tax=Araneus ventricosus TaxID=182803 RepID=A0A4Y2MEI7_ARAVE|nr:Acetoacetyl-CoA synthetase [Araneus ventricosus]